MPHASRPSPRAIIVALLLLAFALRVWNLGGQSLWWDEAFTWQMTSHGWDNFWHVLLTGDRNPPLYFVTVALWGGVAGWSEFSLRFWSVVWDVIGLAFLFHLTKRWFDTQAGIWALAVAAISPAFVVYSQEARMYSAFFALTAATLYFGLRIADFGSSDGRLAIRDRSPRSAPGGPPTFQWKVGHGQAERGWRQMWPFLLSEGVLLLTHYFAVPIVAAINLFALIALFRQKAHWRPVARWIGSQILAALPLLVWTMIVLATPGSLTLAREPAPDVAMFAYQVGMLWMTGVRALDTTYAVLALSALGLIALASIGAWQADRRSASSTIAFGGASLGIAFALTGVLTSFHPRYLLPYSIPFFALIGASAAAVTSRRRTGIVVGGLVILVSIGSTLAGWQVASEPQSAKDDARGVAAYLDDHAIAGDVILIEANDYTLPYYYHGPASIRMITASTNDAALTQLSDAIGDAKRVWLAHWNISTQDPRGYWPFLLNQSGWLADWQSFHGYEVYQYDLQAGLYDPPLKASAIDFGAWLSPRQAVLSYHDGGNGALTWAADWRRIAASSGPIWQRLSLALTDNAGQRIASIDADLRAGWNYYALPIPPGTPPAVYTVTLKLYNTQATSNEKVLAEVSLPRRLTSTDPYRTLSGYKWETPINGDVAAGVQLESFAIGEKSPHSLASVDVTLRWRKIGSASNIVPHLRLVQADRAWATIGSNLFARDYPIEQWAEGETVIDRLKITYPPVLGQMQLQIGQGDQWVTLTTLSLDQSALKFEPPMMPHTQSAKYGDLAELLGYDLKSDSIAPDRPLDLTLYWRALNTDPITTSFTVFTQLIAPDGHLVAQHDAPPSPATPAWVSGQIIEDRHALTIVDPTYRGPATLIAGWYNSATIVRLKTPNGDDHAALQTPVTAGDP